MTKINGSGDHGQQRRPITPYEQAVEESNALKQALIRWMALARTQREALVYAKQAIDNAKEHAGDILHPQDYAFLVKILDVTTVPQFDIEHFYRKTEELTKAVQSFLSVDGNTNPEEFMKALTALHAAAFTIQEVAGLAPEAANDAVPS